MGIRIRNDIFNDSGISVDFENIQENPLKAVIKNEKTLKSTDKLEKFTKTVNVVDKFMKTVNVAAKQKETYDMPEISSKTAGLVMGARARGEKRKKESEEMEMIGKKSEETKISKEKKEGENEVETETAQKKLDNVEADLVNDLDDGDDWFDARKFIMKMKSRSNKKPRLDVVESTVDKNLDNIIAAVKETTPSSATETKSLKVSNRTKETTTLTTEIKLLKIMSNHKKVTVKTVLESTSKKNLDNVIANVKSLRFSNQTADTVLTICQLCHSQQYFVNMRAHTRKAHQLSISDYKAEYGALKDHIVEEIYHECGICSKALLLDSDSMAPHVKSNGLTHKEYSARFMTLRQQSSCPSYSSTSSQHKTMWSPKKTMEKSVKEFSAQELLEQLQAMISEN